MVFVCAATSTVNCQVIEGKSAEYCMDGPDRFFWKDQVLEIPNAQPLVGCVWQNSLKDQLTLGYLFLQSREVNALLRILTHNILRLITLGDRASAFCWHIYHS